MTSTDGADGAVPERAPGGAVERRLSLYYTLAFASIGVTTPFFVPWLDHRGIEPSLAGLIVASPSIGMGLTTVALGGWADRLADWRTAVLACDWAVFVACCWLLWRREVVDIFVVWALVGILIAAKMPILDGATLSLTRRRGTDYARIRALGSLGFITALLLGGALFQRTGFGAFVPVLAAIALVRALAAHALPRFRAPLVAAPLVTAPLVARASARRLLHPGFLMVVAGAGLINGAHAFFYSFGVLHWLQVGYAASTASLLWSVGVLVEVVLMWRFASVARRLSARHCLLVAGLAAVCRWSVSTLEPPLWGWALLQGLHGVTFGLTFVATVVFVSRRVLDRDAARAQALAATLATGALAGATLASGFLYERLGVHGYWLMALMAGTGVGLIAASYRTDLDEIGAPAAPTALGERRP